MFCNKCGQKILPDEINKKNQEAHCANCGHWFFYGMLEQDYENGMSPDDGTEQASREYKGTTKFRR